MNENLNAYTFDEALKVIEKYALSLPAGLIIGPNGELHLPPLPAKVSIIVPKDLGLTNISPAKWEVFAYSFYRVMVLADDWVEAARKMRELVKAWDEQQKFMYKGKDENNYVSFEETRYADKNYVEQENPNLSSKKR